MKRKLALAGVSLVVSLLLGEVALRALGYYGVRGAYLERIEFVDDPVLDYRRAPSRHWVKNNLRYDINSRGWRDVEHTLEKPPGTYRILSIGDSVTNGHGVNAEEIYSSRLQAGLDAEPPDDRDYEVVRITLGALNTVQAAHLAKIEGLLYSPDLVVLGYVLNDPAPGASLASDMENAHNKSWLVRLKERAEYSSLVHLSYRTLQGITWRLRQATGRAEVADYVSDDYFARLHRTPKSWQRVEIGLDQLAEVGATSGAEILVAIFPIFHDFETYGWTDLHHQVAQAAQERGFHVIDLLDAYRGLDAGTLLVVEGDHIHPNPRGHQIAADAIERYIRANLLGRTSEGKSREATP